MIARIFTFLALALPVWASEPLPSARTPAANTWENSGATIVTGRTVYATITATGDSTDRTAEINAALAANPNNQTVKLGPGNFVISSQILHNRTNRSLVGTLGASGEKLTTIDFRQATANSIGIQLGSGESWNWPTGGRAVTVAGMTKGAKTFTLSSITSINANQIVRIFFENEALTPTLSVYGLPRLRSQIFYVTSVNSGASTITVAGEGCVDDYSGLSGATLYTYQSTRSAIGLEDLILECANSVGGLGTIERPLVGEGLYNSWIRNVELKNFKKKGFYLNSCLRVSILGNDLLGIATVPGSSMGGMVFDTLNNSRVENNLITNTFPHFEVNFSSVGNVFGYNFFLASFTAGGGLNTNHGAHNSFNLYEGNIAQFVQADGYFGTVSDDLVFRNWFYGRPLSDPLSGYTAALNRFTRRYTLIGNQFGKTGVGTVGYSLGNPNIGNGLTVGQAKLSAGDPWRSFDVSTGAPRTWNVTLTNRATALTGTLTFESGKGVEVEAHRADAVAGGQEAYIVVKFSTIAQQILLIITSVTGDTATFNGAALTLPLVDDTGVANPSHAGFQEEDLDVEETLIAIANYHGGATNGIPSGEDVGSYTLRSSYYLSAKPDWFGDLPWPIFGSATPTESYGVNAAGYRYVNGVPPDATPAAPTFTTHPTTQSATVGDNVVLTVAGTGLPGPTLQWRKGGVDISGATGYSLTLTNVQLSDAGSYDCVATNSEGAATSSAAVLTVNTAPSEGGTATIQTLNISGSLNIAP